VKSNVGGKAPTTMTLAFIEAEKRSKERTVSYYNEFPSQLMTPETPVPNTEKVFNYLRDEGSPRSARDIAKAIDLEITTVSGCIYQLKERGLAKIVKEPGEFIKAHVEPHDIYVRKTPGRDTKTKRKAKRSVTPKPSARIEARLVEPSQVVTSKATASGVKIQVAGFSFSVEDARAVYKDLHIIFGRD
jgi:DNA-binding MarR family transcriptional regulator